MLVSFLFRVVGEVGWLWVWESIGMLVNFIVSLWMVLVIWCISGSSMLL